jgi:hypothetical protein
MLYLPGLKMLRILCLTLPPQPTVDVATAALTAPIDFEVMAAEKNRCPETQHLLGSSSLTIAFCQTYAQHLVVDVSTGVVHPVVLEKFPKDIFFTCTTFHTLGGLPPGVMSLLDMSGQGHSSLGQTCLHCQHSKTHCHTRTRPLHISVRYRRFSHLHIDLVGLLQYCNNYNYILPFHTFKS